MSALVLAAAEGSAAKVVFALLVAAGVLGLGLALVLMSGDRRGKIERRQHLPVDEQGRWLASALRGHYQYYAVPDNIEALHAFREQAVRYWFVALRRRSQRTTVTWERMGRLADRWLPQPRILHLWPEERFHARTQGRSPVR